MTNQLDKIHLLLETMKQYAAVPITKQADLIKQPFIYDGCHLYEHQQQGRSYFLLR